jgi:hypothetical protein
VVVARISSLYRGGEGVLAGGVSRSKRLADAELYVPYKARLAACKRAAAEEDTLAGH